MRFSIVICTYNREKYIGASLDSVCRQTFANDNFEIIVIDNNSPDKTADICRAYIEQYSQVQLRYILETEQGISFARNRGIKEAKGEFIVFIDDDETIDNFYLEKLDSYLTQYPDARLCATSVVPVYETEKPKWLSHYTMRLITGYYNKGSEVKTLGGKDYPGTGHAIIKKELFTLFGDFNTQLGRKGSSLLGAEDKDMFLRLIENNIDCYYFPDIPIYHHIPDSKLTNYFFHRLTYSIGKSERIRTKSISEKTYRKRLYSEMIKWSASIVLCLGYTLALSPSKGWKLIQFRWNVSKGLLGK
ncbi:glycosyltransferase [Dysgonomonas sp. ZJ279]|uniref:glycosyltransferase n=1 Tax=Dysgonomonas sp. ZJ279 TaxID=2709796 RepID=UPI0013EA4B61|nr:glycosyltransferase [Dysgonomonas sp. ZJ279]